MKRKSLYAQHRDDWLTCTRCPLHEHRRNVVLCRGKIPADVLFVGEAPGESEDVLGSPFKGPAGQLLDEMIADAFSDLDMRVAFTNLVGCIPHGEDGNKYDVPKEALKACRPRLVELCKLVKPRLVVQVGVLSAKHWTVKDWEALIDRDVVPTFVKIDHPAFILRSSEADRGLLVQRCVVVLSDAAESTFTNGG